MTSKPHVAVVGAGAFGGWTALYLLRGGARVTLLDAWGPGNSRASSGGETRVIRGAYGPDQPYTKLAARALDLWRERQAQWKRKFFFPIGAQSGYLLARASAQAVVDQFVAEGGEYRQAERLTRRGSKLAGSSKLLTSAFITNFLYRGH